MTSMRLAHWFGVASVALVIANAAQGTTVTLKNAWMRPAPAGSPSAQAYVDIVSDTALELTGASTPASTSVEVVLVTTRHEGPVEQVVATLPVGAGPATRLAYLGHHLRLKEVRRDLRNGEPVPLTLEFTDATGQKVVATTNIVVRGVLLPQHLPRETDQPDSATAPSP
jgi:hypothetical protein